LVKLLSAARSFPCHFFTFQNGFSFYRLLRADDSLALLFHFFFTRGPRPVTVNFVPGCPVLTGKLAVCSASMAPLDNIRVLTILLLGVVSCLVAIAPPATFFSFRLELTLPLPPPLCGTSIFPSRLNVAGAKPPAVTVLNFPVPVVSVVRSSCLVWFLGVGHSWSFLS